MERILRTIYNTTTGRIIRTRDVTFLEDKPGGLKTKSTDVLTNEPKSMISADEDSSSSLSGSDNNTFVSSRPKRARKKRSIFDPSVEAKKPQLLSSRSVEGRDVANLFLGVFRPSELEGSA